MEKKFLTTTKERTYSKWTNKLLAHINLQAASEKELEDLLQATCKELESRNLIVTNKK